MLKLVTSSSSLQKFLASSFGERQEQPCPLLPRSLCSLSCFNLHAVKSVVTALKRTCAWVYLSCSSDSSKMSSGRAFTPLPPAGLREERRLGKRALHLEPRETAADAACYVGGELKFRVGITHLQ